MKKSNMHRYRSPHMHPYKHSYKYRLLSLRSFCKHILIALWSMLVLIAPPMAHAGDDYLDPEAAFQFSAKMADAKTVEVTYKIADGYYMYRERFHFTADGATLGTADMPKPIVHYDETFQKNVEIYRNQVVIRLPVQANGAFTLHSTGQGCADQGLCYAPIESQAKLSVSGNAGLLGAVASAQNELGNSSAKQSVPSEAQTAQANIGVAADISNVADDEMGNIENSLNSGKLFKIIPLFLLLGIALSFTPCVLPMVPILSSIIVGEGKRVSRRRGLLLSVTYSLGMALVYTAFGIAAGLAGQGLSAALQNPWVLSAFAILMVVLSLSMFNVYQLQVPAAIQSKLARASEQQKAGKLAGVFIMGAISALIVGPCVAAPLAGTLVYISKTRDVVIGGSALFALAIGMSVPLILVGISAGFLLPRAGVWMDAVKRFFGVLMLAVALWMVSPFLPPWAQLLGWAVLGVGYGAYLLRAQQSKWIAKSLGVLFTVFGIAQLVGIASGSQDPLAPLAQLRPQPNKVEFVRVKSVDELDAALAQDKGKPAMLDFYADWCVSCKEMEKLTFSDPRVQSRLNKMVLLQIDVTANNADDKAMLKRFNLFGPPGIILFDKQGNEIPQGRIIGYQDADKFIKSLAPASVM
jgi:thiol:disulfide interchange protein DsbD